MEELEILLMQPNRTLEIIKMSQKTGASGVKADNSIEMSAFWISAVKTKVKI